MFVTESSDVRKKSLRTLIHSSPSCMLSLVIDEIIDGATDTQLRRIERIVERAIETDLRPSKRARGDKMISIHNRLGDSILETKVFPFLDINGHMILARTCHSIYKLAGCPPPPMSYRRPAAWKKSICIDEVDDFSLNKIADFMAPTALDGSWWLNLDWSTLRKLSTLESLTVYIPDKLSDTWDRGNLKHIGDGLPALKYLNLSGPFKDKELEHLTGLKNLHHFKLDASNMNGSGLSHLRDLPIHILELGETIDPTSLILLTDMPLRELHLRYDRLSDQHIMAIQHFKLTKLFIHTSQKVLGYGFIYLSAMPLEVLSVNRKYPVNRTVVDNDTLHRLNCLTSLQGLALSYSAINEIGIQKMHLEQLRYLNLLGCWFVNDNCLALLKVLLLRGLNVSGVSAITDDGVHHLIGHPTLETLRLHGTRITKKCVPYLMAIPRLLSLTVGAEIQVQMREVSPEFARRFDNDKNIHAPAWFYY